MTVTTLQPPATTPAEQAETPLTKERLVREWLIDLRCGRYRKAIGHLRRTLSPACVTGHCVLGVLGEVLARHGVGQWKVTPLGFEAYQWNNHVTVSTIPTALLLHMGFNRHEINIIDRLVIENDLNHRSLPEIADLIEQRLHPLLLPR
jgi:hypothetical protein